jgi:predicted nucleotidyltransferase
MAATSQAFDWTVTPAKVEELVHRIVAAVTPIEVIAFGSRARGEHRADSDLDIAVIVDGTEEDHPNLPGGITSGLGLRADYLLLYSLKGESEPGLSILRSYVWE